MAQDKKEKRKEDSEMVQRLGLFTGQVCVQLETDPITSGLLNLDRLPTR